jgi:hypothetical protein
LIHKVEEDPINRNQTLQGRMSSELIRSYAPITEIEEINITMELNGQIGEKERWLLENATGAGNMERTGVACRPPPGAGLERIIFYGPLPPPPAR